MNFVLDKSSSLPLHAQLKEQIKIALAFGELKPGDILPSIRDLEKDLKVGQAIVRRAYRELQECGILKMKHGKGVLVNRELDYGESKRLKAHCERLSRETIRRAEKLGIHPSSFVRFLHHKVLEQNNSSNPIVFVECNRVQAEEYARAISRAWGLEIPGLSIEELKAMPAAQRRKIKRAITISYHYDELYRMLKGKLISLAVTWGREMEDQIGRLKDGARVVFVFEPDDCERYGELVVKEFAKSFQGKPMRVFKKPSNLVDDPAALIAKEGYDLVYISNRLWDRIPEEVKRMPGIARPVLQIVPLSLEKARIKAGVVI